jgi:hypothetical protein
MDEDKSAAHSVYDDAVAEARVRFELALERLSATTPPNKAGIDWSHAGSAVRLLELTKIMCRELSVDEADVAEGYGE